MRFDSSGLVTSGMFDETWRRFVVKMATGSGKTKVLSLILAWSFFHKLYEPESGLSRNFLIITPNIIVLDRIRKDFEGLKIFFDDPVLPDDGVGGRSWHDDFQQISLHVQDEVRIIRPIGNIFLTNIHRVYAGDDTPASPDDDNTMDYFLGKRPSGATTDSKVDLSMIVRDIDELMILNDEAHHIHDPRLAWFKSIDDINNRLKLKDSALSLQIDTTATPKHRNGAIFVQTVADYPLVEAISQNVVKHPVLPDAPSRAKLVERQSAKFTERYADYLHLGVIEWRKAYEEHQKADKKAILFVMTDDTRNCDDVSRYLEDRYQDLKDAVLVIHTKNNGEISESKSGKAKEELEELRQQANDIDGWDSPYKAIVSVMMLTEGWDVRNVTTIVGLRAFGAKSQILPEQTLGRGLRKMYPGGLEEYVSVIGYFAQTIMRELRLVSGYDVLYGKVKAFVRDELFDQPVDLESPNTLRNLSELVATKTVIESFKKAINALTVRDRGDSEIRDTIKLRQTRPFVVKDQDYLIPKKSLFNRIVGDSPFELQFAAFLEKCDDVISHAKIYLAVGYKLDYVNAEGDISTYYPDFLVKVSDREKFVVETKGQEDLDVPLKMQRLKQWCEDINRAKHEKEYDFVYVDQESFEKYKPTSFRQLVEAFKEYK